MISGHDGNEMKPKIIFSAFSAGCGDEGAEGGSFSGWNDMTGIIPYPGGNFATRRSTVGLVMQRGVFMSKTGTNIPTPVRGSTFRI